MQSELRHLKRQELNCKVLLVLEALCALVRGFRAEDVASIVDDVFEMIQERTETLQKDYRI